MSLLHKNETITNSQPAKIKILSVQSRDVLPSLSPYKQLNVLKDRLELFVILNRTYTLTKVLAAKLPPKSLPIFKKYVYQNMAARFQLSQPGGKNPDAVRKKTGKNYFQVCKILDMVFFSVFSFSFKFSIRKLEIQLHNLKLSVYCVPTTILGDSTYFGNLILTITLHLSDTAGEVQKCT